LGEESDVKCDRLAQHVLATEGRPVPSATMEDFLPPPSFSFLAAPVHRLIPLRSSSRSVGHFRAIASPSALVSTRLASARLDSVWLGLAPIRLALLASPVRQVTYLPTYLPRDRIIAQKIDEGIVGPSASVTVVERIPIV